MRMLLLENILNCKDRPLLDAIALAIDNFVTLSPQQRYTLNFSGGKDSHVLLGIYLLYLKLNHTPLDLVVKFADTELESKDLYCVVEKAESWAELNQIAMMRVKSDKSYWFIQYALGYPVPTHFARWCTGRLKIDPLEKAPRGQKRTPITGRHLGESSVRDKRLKSGCTSGECGTDKIKKSIDPILHFTNCMVWDSLFYFDGIVLPKSSFDYLSQMYKQQETTKEGSLRMGCFHCPVVAIKTLEKNVQNSTLTEEGLQIRYHLEELRAAKRINNPRTKKAGAIHIEDRRKSWQGLDKDYLLKENYITQQDIDLIDETLKSDYAYPPLYKKEWIDQQHSFWTD